MGRETILFKSEEKMSSGESAELLRTIADKVEQGRVLLVQGDKEVELEIPQRVEVQVKAEKEEGRNKTTKKIEVEIEWRVGDDTASGPMKIK